jgi:hypothetical protein
MTKTWTITSVKFQNLHYKITCSSRCCQMTDCGLALYEWHYRKIYYKLSALARILTLKAQEPPPTVWWLWCQFLVSDFWRPVKEIWQAGALPSNSIKHSPSHPVCSLWSFTYNKRSILGLWHCSLLWLWPYLKGHTTSIFKVPTRLHCHNQED